MRSENLEKKLHSYSLYVFTINDIIKITSKSRKYVSLFLSKNKRFTRIERGKYALNDASIYAIASGIAFPSYVSGISAFRYYNLISQMPNVIEVMAARQHKSISIYGYTIKFTKLPASRIFGYRKEDSALIAEPEKAVIDSLYMGLDYSYVNEAMENYKESIDADKLIKYAVRMNSSTVISKLGFLMDCLGIDSTKLIKLKSKHRVRVSPLANKLDKKWGVVYA